MPTWHDFEPVFKPRRWRKRPIKMLTYRGKTGRKRKWRRRNNLKMQQILQKRREQKEKFNTSRKWEMKIWNESNRRRKKSKNETERTIHEKKKNGETKGNVNDWEKKKKENQNRPTMKNRKDKKRRNSDLMGKKEKKMKDEKKKKKKKKTSRQYSKNIVICFLCRSY